MAPPKSIPLIASFSQPLRFDALTPVPVETRRVTCVSIGVRNDVGAAASPPSGGLAGVEAVPDMTSAGYGPAAAVNRDAEGACPHTPSVLVETADADAQYSARAKPLRGAVCVEHVRRLSPCSKENGRCGFRS